MCRQRRGRCQILGEAVADRERPGERLHDPLLLGLATIAKESVQLLKIGNAGHRGSEAALHGLDGTLGVGLLVAAAGHAEAGVEDVVAGQRRVPRMESAFASFKDQRSDSFWIVPLMCPTPLCGCDLPWRLMGRADHGSSAT